MKKITIAGLIGLALGISSFAYFSWADQVETRIGNGTETSLNYYYTKIDGCDYIVTAGGYPRTYTMVHKGNCSNAIHSKQ